MVSEKPSVAPEIANISTAVLDWIQDPGEAQTDPFGNPGDTVAEKKLSMLDGSEVGCLGTIHGSMGTLSEITVVAEEGTAAAQVVENVIAGIADLGYQRTGAAGEPGTVSCSFASSY